MDKSKIRLRDGPVFVAGGRYNAGARVDLLTAEIYDPFGAQNPIPGESDVGQVGTRVKKGRSIHGNYLLSDLRF